MRSINADALKIALDTFATLVGFRGVYDRGQVMECIDAAPTIGGWISVKDDMPKEHPSIFAPWYGGSQWKKAMWRKESDSVLLAYKTPDTGAYVIKEGRTHDGKFYSGNIVLDNNCEVTHWMEMPKPPKEG